MVDQIFSFLSHPASFNLMYLYNYRLSFVYLKQLGNDLK